MFLQNNSQGQWLLFRGLVILTCFPSVSLDYDRTGDGEIFRTEEAQRNGFPWKNSKFFRTSSEAEDPIVRPMKKDKMHRRTDTAFFQEDEASSILAADMYFR